VRFKFALTAYLRFAQACAGAAQLCAGASMAQSAAMAASGCGFSGHITHSLPSSSSGMTRGSRAVFCVAGGLLRDRARGEVDPRIKSEG